MPAVPTLLRRAAPVAILVAAALAARGLPWPAGRMAAGALALLILPGWGLQSVSASWGLGSPALRLAVACVGPWAVHGVLATLLAPAGVALHVPAALSVAVCIGLWLGFGSRRRAGPPRVPARGSREGWLLAATIGIAIWYGTAPADLDLRSDIYAHVAAMRACLQEGRIFPLQEFHAAAFCPPAADPRFGTAHALFATWAWFARLDPLALWQVGSGALALVWGGAVAAVCAAATPPGLARWLAFVLFMGCYGGRFLDPQRLAAYPLWLGMAGVLTAMAALLQSGAGGRPTQAHWWVVGCLLAGAGAVHAMAFALGCVLLAAAFVVESSLRRELPRAIVALASPVLPVMAIRFALSHADANPIHQLPWYPLQWRPGLISASPVFLAGWLFPMGVLALPLVARAWHRGRQAMASRWSVLLLCGALAWICIPWLLTPSLRLFGFLPMRLIMGALFPLVWAWWLVPRAPVARRGRARMAVALLALAYGTIALANRASMAHRGGGDSFVRSPEWAGVVRALKTPGAAPPIVLSDPYTMLALKGCSPAYVVAVPEGRSSPADPAALTRLHDTWRAMSPGTPGSTTDSLLQRHGVTHVVINQDFAGDLLGFEYSVDQESLPQQRHKFASNPQRFKLVLEAGPFSLFEVIPGAQTHDPDEAVGCGRPLHPASTLGHALHDGFVLLEGSVRPPEPALGLPPTAVALVGWTKLGLPPYRDVVIRADAVDDPVPPQLAWCAKPVRRALEAILGTRYRCRWQTVPEGGRCPTFTLDEARSLRIELPLVPPANLAPGSYNVTIQLVQNSEFLALSPRDLLRDDDVYSGPTLGRWLVEGSADARGSDR